MPLGGGSSRPLLLPPHGDEDQGKALGPCMPASFASTQLESDRCRFENPLRFRRMGNCSSSQELVSPEPVELSPSSPISNRIGLSRCSLIVRCVQILDWHAAGRSLRLHLHARLVTIRELDASRFEGTLDIVKSASVGSSPA